MYATERQLRQGRENLRLFVNEWNREHDPDYIQAMEEVELFLKTPNTDFNLTQPAASQVKS